MNTLEKNLNIIGWPLVRSYPYGTRSNTRKLLDISTTSLTKSVRTRPTRYMNFLIPWVLSSMHMKSGITLSLIVVDGKCLVSSWRNMD